MKKGLVVFVAFEGLVALQALLAYRDNFLTVSQMQQIGILHGLPFLWHLGMWGDVFAISPLVAVIVAKYSQQWTVRHIVVSVIASILVTIALGWFYTLSNTPQAHMRDHHTNAAGYVHLLYTMMALVVLTLMYFYTSRASFLFVIITDFILIVHVLFGTHIALGFLSHYTELAWYPDEPLKSPMAWATLVILGSFLWWRTTRLIPNP